MDNRRIIVHVDKDKIWKYSKEGRKKQATPKILGRLPKFFWFSIEMVVLKHAYKFHLDDITYKYTPRQLNLRVIEFLQKKNILP